MRVHFIAIGGSAMHNLALALRYKGDVVTGSDDAIFEPSRSRLAAVGLLPEEEGWFAEKISDDIEVVVLGMHAKSDNPELLKARELGLKVLSYPEFIYEHAKNKTRVVIGGSHGKTTITAMILHVMEYHGVAVDYLVGAQLEGFDRMVHLTTTNDFMLIEGDEYLASALDPRPKFHIYEPNIALISGIAWDHINVFPTFESYCKQFEIFVEKIVNGGILIYNEEDPNVQKVVEDSVHPIRKIGYSTPEHSLSNGVTYLETQDGPMPLEIFGLHNLSNLNGAKWVCQNMGIDEADFYEAIGSFNGAAKRLERIYSKEGVLVFKDFAHAPSKVMATVAAVKEQFPDQKIYAYLELHSYSSLNKAFLQTYAGTLDAADEAVVFYSKEALILKGMPELEEQDIQKGFALDRLSCFTDAAAFKSYFDNVNSRKGVHLFMSSGNYGGIVLEDIFV